MGRYYGPDSLKPYMMAFWDTESWLYGKSGWSKEDQDAFDFLYDLNLFRGKFDQILESRNRDLYFERYGIDYGDIFDPRNAHVGSTFGMALNFVSDNVKRLYR